MHRVNLQGAEELKKKARSSGNVIETVQLDVTNQQSVDKAFDFVEKKIGQHGRCIIFSANIKKLLIQVYGR